MPNLHDLTGLNCNPQQTKKNLTDSDCKLKLNFYHIEYFLGHFLKIRFFICFDKFTCQMSDLNMFKNSKFEIHLSLVI